MFFDVVRMRDVAHTMRLASLSVCHRMMILLTDQKMQNTLSEFRLAKVLLHSKFFLLSLQMPC